MSSLQELFRSHLPADAVLSSPEDLAFYGKDSCSQFDATASLVLLPSSAEQVKLILQLCNQHSIPLVPSGGRTGYSGGATATRHEVVLSLSRLNRVIGIDKVDQTIRCEAGVTTEAVRNAALAEGLYYPVDFASKGSSQIGGNIATNAGGIRVIRYGSTREWVLGMKVITGAGEELNFNGPLFKNATGYDFRNLFIGSEGTLGIITEATLRLTSPPKDSTLALCAIETTQNALDILEFMRRKGFTVNVIEYFEQNAVELVIKHTGVAAPFKETFPCYAVIEVETPESTAREQFEAAIMELYSSAVIRDSVIADSERHRQPLMALRERISESIGKTTVAHKNDISVPISQIPSFVARYREMMRNKFPDFGVIVFGHIGDGNLHLNVLKPEKLSAQEFFRRCENFDSEAFAIVKDFSGSISAEHGVGLLKKKYLTYSRSPREIELMKKMKSVFDPKGILNPGKIFDS